MAKQRRTYPGDGGFTLIELMVVLTIIGILAGLTAPAMVGFVEKARVTAAVATGGCLAKAFALFAVTSQSYRFPTEIASYRDLVAMANANGCYLPPGPGEPGYDSDDSPSVFYRSTWCYDRPDSGRLEFPIQLQGCPPAAANLASPAMDMEVWLGVPGVERSPGKEVVVVVSTFRGVRVLEGDSP
jgi:prepilin-type N-terminal cleavage/methylation domain-containing protein